LNFLDELERHVSAGIAAGNVFGVLAFYQIGALGIRCAATKNIKGLRNSIGYLTVSDDEFVFVTRRFFRYCDYRMKIQEIEFAEWKRGLLMNRFVLRTAKGESAFYTFKNLDIFSL